MNNDLHDVDRRTSPYVRIKLRDDHRCDVAEIGEACDQDGVGEAREAAVLLLSNLDDLPARS